MAQLRPFNHDDDDTDYDALKRERSEDRESIKEIRESLKVDEDDLFAKLAAAAARATPEQKQSAARRAALINRSGGVTKDTKIDTSAYDNIVHYAEAAPSIPAKYAEIVDTLDRFKFAQDEDRRQRQVKIVCNALRTALQDLVLEEVAVNTKTAFKGYAEKVVKAPGGLKVYFNFDDNHFAVTAKGGFYGDETICVYQTNGKIKASVMRIHGEDHSDLSDSFEILIQRTK